MLVDAEKAKEKLDSRNGRRSGLMKDTPITFREPSYALFDPAQNAVRTTKWGNLAIFSVKAVAERWAATQGDNLRVVEVFISAKEWTDAS